MDKIIRLSLEPWHFKILQKHAYASEQEACGVLVGTIQNGVAYVDEIRPIINTCQLPVIGFEFEPQSYLQAIQDTDFYEEGATKKLLGIWHTHPEYPGFPSTTDWKAAQSGKIVEGLYFIYSTADDDLHCYVWNGETFEVIRRFDERA